MLALNTPYNPPITSPMRPMLAAVLALLLLGMAADGLYAQATPSGAIEIEQGGRLWIEGSASMVDYTCRAEKLSGNGSIENSSQPRQNVQGDGAVAINVSIPVKSLECGKKAMNNDMYEALKADEHSSITYRLLYAQQASDSSVTGSAENWMNIETTGILEIAGVEDTTHVLVKGQLLEGNRFRVTGSKQINMDTYDIEPPTALFGLIKAKKDLTVHFDVTVRLQNDVPASSRE